MSVSRRSFLKSSSRAMAGTAVGALAGLGVDLQPKAALAQELRIARAEVVPSVCCYCSVGCGTLIHVADGQIVNIEGNPASPINRGNLCPKGAALFQLHVNPNRLTKVLHRQPGATQWEVVDLDWAMDRVAQLVKQTRDETFVERDEAGRPLNRTLGIAHLGGATLDNEENYLIKKLFTGGLGIVAVENQARI